MNCIFLVYGKICFGKIFDLNILVVLLYIKMVFFVFSYILFFEFVFNEKIELIDKEEL